MKNLRRYVALPVRLALFLTVALGGSALAQSLDAKKDDAAGKVTASGGNVQTVDARQSGAWAVGIDPAQNTVQLPNTEAAPLPVKVVGSGPARTPFQRRIIVTPLGTGFQTGFLPIPAGKRLVIENISAISRIPAGLRMEMRFFTYLDNGDGQGGIAAITFHRIPLIDQGVFDGVAIASASYKALIFADSQIGNQSYQVGVQARLNGSPNGSFTQAQFTFSGYLEDLPAPQAPLREPGANVNAVPITEVDIPRR